jgi:hypothetical protein
MHAFHLDRHAWTNKCLTFHVVFVVCMALHESTVRLGCRRRNNTPTELATVDGED